MPYQVVKDFEKALCDYTGAKYAVTTTSCTMALLLACAWGHHKERTLVFIGDEITFSPALYIPKRTYCSVPMSIRRAGFNVAFRDENWTGAYQLWPLPVYDCARRFTSGMYESGQFQCVSFHWSKILGLGQGGAILHDDEDADIWLRRMRFDGRTEGISPAHDKITEIGYHAYMSPETAAHGLMKLSLLPPHNEDLPNSDYPDLSKMEIFR